MEQKPIFEIAVRKVKDGRKFDFVTERSKFIKTLKAQDGVSNDREFQSFYALPEPDEQEVFIGMTQYASLETLNKVQQNVYPAFAPFAETMDLKAYVFVKQTEGPKLDLSNVGAKPGQILEVGVRRVHNGKEKEFNRYRKEFVALLSSYDGVLESYEFEVVAGQDTENLTVGMTVYENQAALMNLIPDIMQKEITQKYFSTFDVVASQFAF